MRRNARRIALDLKHPDGQAVVQKLVERADVVLESFRPGVAARLGLGHEDLLKCYPQLVYCSISGYGQDGPYARRPGHDLNYLALGGFLHMTGQSSGPPVIPGTIIADLAAGGQQAVIGILAALLAKTKTGRGQFIDISLQEGIVALMAPMLALVTTGQRAERGQTLLTGATPWYNVYETSDKRYLAVAALEPWFYAKLCTLLQHPAWIELQFDQTTWHTIYKTMAEIFRAQPLTYWRQLLEEAETCVTTIPTLEEVLADPQLLARETFVALPTMEGKDGLQVRPLPRLSETPASVRRPAEPPGNSGTQILTELGYTTSESEQLRFNGGVG
jgi:alpha-methylacyl-CoA racemase